MASSAAADFDFYYSAAVQMRAQRAVWVRCWTENLKRQWTLLYPSIEFESTEQLRAVADSFNIWKDTDAINLRLAFLVLVVLVVGPWSIPYTAHMLLLWFSVLPFSVLQTLPFPSSPPLVNVATTKRGKKGGAELNLVTCRPSLVFLTENLLTENEKGIKLNENEMKKQGGLDQGSFIIISICMRDKTKKIEAGFYKRDGIQGRGSVRWRPPCKNKLYAKNY